MAEKPKLSVYWAASCGGCEIALVNIHEKLIEVDRHFDFMFCPCLLDTKIEEIEALPDGAIALTLFNGAIRTAENLEMAHLMRRKSRVLVACGSCAADGGIPALANLGSAQQHLRGIFLEAPSNENRAGTLPRLRSRVPEGELELPEFLPAVRSLRDVVDVDYRIPGCPPEPFQIANVLDAIIRGETLPPKGSVLGGGLSSVCAECAREKNDKKIAAFVCAFETPADSGRCLLEQGVVCMGIATRDGCGALCPKANMPCIGCYGPPEGVADQGAKMVAALGSVLDLGGYKGMDEQQAIARADAAADGIPDPAGTFYKFSLAGSKRA